MVQGLSAPEQTRLLLVDDDPVVLQVTRRRLEKAGHHVVSCSSGSEALATLALESFDVMLSDVQMPGMTGLKLLRAVREHDLDLPVVLMTGNPDVASAAAAVEYGAFRYLLKPVPFDELTSIVGRAASIGKLARSKRAYVDEFGSASSRSAIARGSMRRSTARCPRCGWPFSRSCGRPTHRDGLRSLDAHGRAHAAAPRRRAGRG